ncbi:bifunctional DNA primase/helicase, partial [Pseudomonas syringae pv. actinidiae]|nr:bifunctional DNA primase/helicase [Pseudomonas syringae pv. actinidiae]
MSSTSYPAQALEQLAAQRKNNLPLLVWALDNEPSARGYLQRWVKQSRELGYSCAAALVPQNGRRKVDWNDLHQRWGFEDTDKREQRRQRDLDVARHEGDLLLAPSPREKAILMYTWEDSTSEFHFEFANRMYWAKFDLSKLEDEQRALLNSDDHDNQLLNDRQARTKVLESVCALKMIANCNFEALYKQVNDVTGDAWFYFQVDTPNDNAPEKFTFTPKQISSSSEFK